ncbi:MAG: sulfurtransferase TusA family protein [Planctomycetes bacterium]|nr:sulfurtransferase TusA family protein [Planctomycetota bacterium]
MPTPQRKLTVPPPPLPPSPSRRVDLRGERCPYTFIKTRLAMEEMSPGEILEVLLDFVPAFSRVPASMAVLGHREVWNWGEEGPVKGIWFECGVESGRTER